MATRSKSNELKLTRVFDAPLSAVWDAWNDPEKAAHWWGPRGFTLTTHSKDLRSGGTWVYTMHGPDGTDYPNITRYLEVKKHECMIYDHGATETTPPMFRVSVYFIEKNGKTTMDMTMALPTPEAAENTRKFIKKAGGDSTWDRLAEYVEKESSGKELFVINRSFDVPIERMYEMWINPEHLSRWLPPTGQQMEIVRGDIRVGATTLFRMFGNGIEFYGRLQYREIQPPNRIVYTQQFCDVNEQPSRHPFAPTWPETMHTTVELTPEGPDRTRVTVLWEPSGSTTREELEFFLKERRGMSMGWTGSFDKLEALFEEAEAPVA
jgi:uncharacterized protein YndB with AHSA1/START domain